MTHETKETVRTWTSVISSVCAVIGVALLILVNYHTVIHLLFK
jgi:hypothetical protein